MVEARLQLYNGLALAGCVLASTALGAFAPDSPGAFSARPNVAAAPAPLAIAPGGLTDATGERFEPRSFQRIGSASILADRLLLELCEPGRIVAFSPQAQQAWDGYRFAGVPTLASLERTESILSLEPDLLLVNGLGDPAVVARLRAVGLPVFDLGPLVGTGSVASAARSIGALLGRAEQAERILDDFFSALRNVSREIPPAERRQGLYVATYGNQLFGGTRGSSFGEVLTFAGLVDASPPELSGWPRYTAEQLLVLDPDVIVTQRGMGDQLCRLPGLGALTACGDRQALVELPPAVLDDPGFGILHAARQVFRTVYAP